MSTVSIHDIAAGVLHEFRRASLSSMKFQKFVYMVYAWYGALLPEPLSDEPFEAWASGPVSRTLFEHQTEQYHIAEWPMGDRRNLTKQQRAVIRSVVRQYGALTGLDLQQLDIIKTQTWHRAYFQEGHGTLINMNEALAEARTILEHGRHQRVD